MNVWLIRIGIMALFALAGAGGVVWYGSHKYHQGYDKAMQDVATAQAEANSKVTAKKRTIKHETQNLDRAGIIRELCSSGWVRDFENCPK